MFNVQTMQLLLLPLQVWKILNFVGNSKICVGSTTASLNSIVKSVEVLPHPLSPDELSTTIY